MATENAPIESATAGATEAYVTPIVDFLFVFVCTCLLALAGVAVILP